MQMVSKSSDTGVMTDSMVLLNFNLKVHKKDTL